MIDFSRDIEKKIKQHIDFKKAIVLLGPRQVGKTTLIEKIASDLDPHYLKIDGDDLSIQLTWSKAEKSFILSQLREHKVIVIDEAQRIENIGLIAKIIVDAKLKKQLFITGSSSLDIKSKINEPMTGRIWEFYLFPFSYQELSQNTSSFKENQQLHHRLVMGCYPEIVLRPDVDKRLLTQLTGSYLYKDIFEKGGIKKPEVLMRIIQALAYQVGSEVSYTEISRLVEVDKNTVMTYITLLEKAFVLFRLNTLSRNLRNEISSSRKIYFYDNGVRNAVINQLAPIEMRNDHGALWENFLMSERLKLLKYNFYHGACYFWRSRDAEIDYIEEIDGQFYAHEFKWNEKAKAKFASAFIEGYNPKSTTIISKSNYQKWLTNYPYNT